MSEQMRFFSLNKPLDWQKGVAFNINFDHEGLKLPMTRQYSVEQTMYLDQLEGPATVRELTLGPNSRMYLLDQESNVWLYDIYTGYIEKLFTNNHHLFSSHSQIVYLQEMLIFLDLSIKDGNVLAVSCQNGQILWRKSSWSKEAFLPLKVTSGSDCLYVLGVANAGQQTAHGESLTQSLMLIKLDVHGREIGAYHLSDWRLSAELELSLLQEQLFMDVGGDEKVFLFFQLEKKLAVFSKQLQILHQSSIKAPVLFSGFGVDSENHIFMGDARTIEQQEEDDRHLFQFAENGQLLELLPVFKGRTDKLMLDNQNRIYIWNQQQQLLTLLTLKHKTKHLPTLGPRGVYLFPSLDCTQEELMWHKLTLELTLPEETQISIAYFASDRKEQLIKGKWIDLDQLIKDEQLSLHEKLASLEDIWSPPLINPQDALFHEAQGRYLWLKIELHGTDQKTPIIHKLRAFYPRTSFLDYLPAVYQEDEKSKQFLERFLSLFGTFYDDLEDKINQISQYFDVDVVAGDYLRWLASWLGIIPEKGWSEERLRRMLKLAPELYQKRGTREHIEAMVEIFTEEKPYIIEHFQVKKMRELVGWKEIVDRLYGEHPYTFCVLVKPEAVNTKEKLLMIQKMLEEEKPAYTEAKLIILEPWMYLNRHTYLGINTVLSELTLMRLDQKSAMPYDTVVIDVDQDNRMDIHTRLEVDSGLT